MPGLPKWLSGEESAVQETQVQYLGQERPLEEEMETHSSILTWRIPWTEEPGRLQSVGSQRVTRTCACIHTHTHTHTHNSMLMDAEWNLIAVLSCFYVSLVCNNSSFKYHTNLYFMQIIYIFFSCVYAFIPLNSKIMRDGFQGHENSKMNNIHS